MRKALNPAFSQRNAISLIPVFAKHYHKLSEEISNLQGQHFDVFEITVLSNMKATLETNFGYEDVDDSFEYNIFEEYNKNIILRVSKVYLYPDFLYSLSNLCKQDQKVDANARIAFKNVLEKRKEYWKTSQKHNKLFIDELIDYAGENEEMLYQNMMIVLIAGYETTALTISFAVLLLAMHPEIDAKIADELNENYEIGDVITHEMMRKLTFLDMVVKETLRLLPTVPVTCRGTTKKTCIEKIGKIPKGTTMIASFYNLHRDKDVWGEDADEFNPERFSPENSSCRHAYAFLPFGVGEKSCIGYQYGLIAVKVGLISLLSHFKFHTNLKMRDLEYEYTISLKIKNKCMVTAEKRNK